MHLISLSSFSYAIALYTLYVFYLATSDIIKQFRPIIKFASVKAIVFATYYQSLAVKAGSISAEVHYRIPCRHYSSCRVLILLECNFVTCITYYMSISFDVVA